MWIIYHYLSYFLYADPDHGALQAGLDSHPSVVNHVTRHLSFKSRNDIIGNRFMDLSLTLGYLNYKIVNTKSLLTRFNVVIFTEIQTKTGEYGRYNNCLALHHWR